MVLTQQAAACNFSAVLRLSGTCLLLIALLNALNLPWALVQGVAWVSMFSEEQQRAATIREAIEATFGPGAECEICGIVESALEESSAMKAAAQADFLQVKLLPLPQSETILTLSCRQEAYESLREHAVRQTYPLETPPPRVA